MSRPSKTETLQNRAKADVGALLAGAGNARRKAVAAELAAMRKAFDAAAQSIETLLASPLKADADVEALVDGLTRQIDALAKPDGDLEALRNQLQERETQNEELRKMLVKARMDLEAAPPGASGAPIPSPLRLTGSSARARRDAWPSSRPHRRCRSTSC